MARPRRRQANSPSPAPERSVCLFISQKKKKKKIETEKGKRGRKVGERWEQSPRSAERSPKKKKKKNDNNKGWGEKALQRLRGEAGGTAGSARSGRGCPGQRPPPAPPRSRAEPPRPAAQPGRLGQGAGPLKRGGQKGSPPRLCVCVCVCVSPLVVAPVAVGSATFAEPRLRGAARREAGSVRASLGRG